MPRSSDSLRSTATWSWSQVAYVSPSTSVDDPPRFQREKGGHYVPIVAARTLTSLAALAPVETTDYSLERFLQEPDFAGPLASLPPRCCRAAPPLQCPPPARPLRLAMQSPTPSASFPAAMQPPRKPRLLLMGQRR